MSAGAGCLASGSKTGIGCGFCSGHVGADESYRIVLGFGLSFGLVQ